MNASLRSPDAPVVYSDVYAGAFVALSRPEFLLGVAIIRDRAELKRVLRASVRQQMTKVDGRWVIVNVPWEKKE